MSEPTPEVPEVPAEAPKPAPPADPAPAQETDWKAEARKWEQRAKENKEAADRIAAIEAEKSDLAQKVAAYEAEKERSKTVAEVAEAAGVPADALRGSTREELEAHAEVLKSLIKPSAPVIPGQEKSPSHVGDDPMREFARSLFDQAKNQ